MSDDDTTARSTGRRWVVVGIGLTVIGTALPWFTVGPASQLGVATSGRWVLLLAGVAGVASIPLLRDGSGHAARVGVGCAAVSGAIAVLRLVSPPESMRPAVGIAVCAVGSLVTALAARRAVRPSADAHPPREPARPAVRIARRTITVTLLGALILALWPLGDRALPSSPDPADDFDVAVQRFEALVDAETDVFEPCHSNLLHHGRSTDVVVVLFHGLTNCPRQYLELGQALHAEGANVLITRAPGHGIATSDGAALAGAGALRSLTAGRLVDFADDTVDLAAGLGDDVRVSGLSMGGVVALWVAQHRDDVERVVAIAPALELPSVPNAVSTVFTSLFTRLPTVTISEERHIDHDYAALSTKGLAATFGLGQAVADRGLDDVPAVDHLTVMLNPDDPLVSEESVVELMDAWSERGADVSIVEFDPIGLRHDLIDVGQPNADPDHVYPLVVDALGFPGAWPT